jgi:phenylacetate-coenzyme A ligase PaaK-like adenylate-forming protein
VLTADIGASTERALLSRIAPRAEVLVVPHHGSRGSLTPAFLAAVSPRVALVPAAPGNYHHHPHPSVIARLAREVLDGRLQMAPSIVIVTSERLADPDRDLISAAFGTPPVNSFGSSEGLNGTAPPGDDVFTFASDRAYIEFVDEHDRRAALGTRAHHVLVTNLTNHAQPLIRYRLDDTMTQLPPAAGHGHQRANVHGRDDEMMRIGDQVVHPLTVRSAILHHSGVREFQAVTRHDGDGRARVELRVVASGPVDLDRLANDVAAALDGAGADADVTASVTDLDRNGASGKTRRFVNL